MTAVVITYDGANPTVGGDEDTWGAELNAGRTKIKADLDALALAPANSIKGNNTGAPQGVDDLTGTQVAAMLPVVVGDSGSGGTKGSVPAPAAGDAAAGKVLTAGGTWGFGETLARGAFTVSTGAALRARNLTMVRNGTGDYTFTLTSAAPDASYGVLFGYRGTDQLQIYLDAGTKDTTSFKVKSANLSAVVTDPTEIYVEVRR